MSNNCSILRDWLSWTNDPELNSSLLLVGNLPVFKGLAD